jgi:hypothetical protein
MTAHHGRCHLRWGRRPKASKEGKRGEWGTRLSESALFGTLQKRLPQELRLARIKTVAAANRYLRERFVPDYNARFAVPAAEPGSAFVAYIGRPLEDVLCVQEDRLVGADNCVSFNRRSLQIPPQRHRRHYVRATVRVHHYPDGRLAIFDGPRCLACFDPSGKPNDAISQAA